MLDYYDPDYEFDEISEDESLKIKQVIDEALKFRYRKSERELAELLGVGPTTLHNWKSRKNWPSDLKMMMLAEKAGIDFEEALLWLNYWRTPKVVRPYYLRLIGLLRKARRDAKAAAATIMVGILGAHFATATPQPEPTENRQSPPTISYIL